MIDFSRVSIGEGLPSCTRCAGKGASAFRDTEDVVTELGSRDVDLVGADSLTHPDIERIVEQAVSMAADRVRIEVASGIDKAKALALIHSGVRHVRVAILGGSADAHDALVSERGAFDRVAETVARLREAGEEAGARMAFSARVPACKHNASELPGAVVAAADMGLDAVAIVTGDMGGEAGGFTPWVAAACDTGIVNTLWVEVEGLPFCLMPAHALHLADSVRATAGQKAPACGKCALDPVCGGLAGSAQPQALVSLKRPEDHEQLAAAVGRARAGVSR